MGKGGVIIPEKLTELEKKIIAIQRSTRTTLPFLIPLHDKCRLHSRWYYNWHQKPNASKIHLGILSLYLMGILVGIIWGIFAGPYHQTRAGNACNWIGGSGNTWETAANWENCGATTPQAADDVTINLASAAVTTNGSEKTVNSLTVGGSASCSLTLGATLNVTANVTVSTSGTLFPVNNTITVGGNWDHSAGTFGAYPYSGQSTVVLTNTGGSATLKGSANSRFYNVTLNASAVYNTLDSIYVQNTLTLNSNAVLQDGARSDYLWLYATSGSIIVDNSGTNSALTGMTYVRYRGAATNVPVTATYYPTLELVPSSANGSFQAQGNITATGLTIDDSTATYTSTFNTNDKTITINGGVSIGGALGAGNGAISAGASTINISGSLAISGDGSLTAGTSTFDFNGAAQAIATNSVAFKNVTFSGSGNKTITNDLDVDGTLSLSAGTLKLDTNNPAVYLAGDVTIANGTTWTKGSGTVTFNGTTTFRDNTASLQNLGTVVVNGTSVTLGTNMKVATSLSVNGGTLSTGAYALGSSTTTVGTLTLGGGTLTSGAGLITASTLTANSGTMTIGSGGVTLGVYGTAAGTYNYNGGTVTWDTNSTLTINGSGVMNVPANTYYNLTLSLGGTIAYSLVNTTTVNGNLSMDADSWNYGTTSLAMSNKNLTVGGNVTMTGAAASDVTLSMTSATLSIGGNYSNTNGILTAGSGAVEFTKAAGTQTLNSGGTGANFAFNNLTHSGAGTLQLTNNNLDVNGNFSQTYGIFDANSRTQTYAGNFSLADNTTFTKGGAITFDGTTETTYEDLNGATQNIGPVTITKTNGTAATVIFPPEFIAEYFTVEVPEVKVPVTVNTVAVAPLFANSII